MEMLDGERHLSVQEVAKRLGKDEETIRRWLRSGKLRGRKIGRLHFVTEAEVERMLRLRKEEELSKLKQRGVGMRLKAGDMIAVVKGGIEYRFQVAEEGGYVVSVPAYSSCISEGDTFEEALENIEDALLGCLAAARELGA